MKTPNIDSRDLAQILQKLKDLVPFYTPEWKPAKGDPGDALMQIFAQMYAGILQRLNRLPDKHFAAYLEMLGIRRLPPNPARAPVSFKLSYDATESVFVPARTPLTADSSNAEPLIFETETAMWATPAKLTHVYSYVPGPNRIYQVKEQVVQGRPVPTLKGWLAAKIQPGDSLLPLQVEGFQTEDVILIGGQEYGEIKEIKDSGVTLTKPVEQCYLAFTAVERMWYSELFHGIDKQAHICYFGDQLLLMLKRQKQFQLELQGDADLLKAMAEQEMCEWQYGGSDWVSLLPVATESPSLDGGKLILRLNIDGEIKEREILDISSRWIRCIVKKKDRVAALSRLSLTLAQITLVDGNGYRAEKMYGTAGPFPYKADPEEFYPFGTSPQTGHVFYFLNDEVFSKKGCKIHLNFHLESPTTVHTDQFDLCEPSSIRNCPPGFVPSAIVSWEYWNGQDWTPLGVDEHLFTEHTGGEDRHVQFTCPEDVTPFTINRKLGNWLRLRIESGDYRYESKNNDDKCEYALFPPLIKNLQLSYTIPYANSTIKDCVSYNNLTYRNHGDEISRNKPFRPFFAYSDRHPSIYLGFAGSLSRGPLHLFWNLVPQMYDEQSLPRLEWEYYRVNRSGDGEWAALPKKDETHHLTKQGILTLSIPHDIAQISLFGQLKFWIRAVDVENKFRTADGALAPAHLPAPKVAGLHLNTVMAVQEETRAHEIVGSSDGSPSQVYSILQPPLSDIAIYVNEWNAWLEEERKIILKDSSLGAYEVKNEQGVPDELWVRWHPTDDIGQARPNDRCYEIDLVSGQIHFGDGLHGMIPPVGTNNIISHSRRGKGASGNVPEGAIKFMHAAIPQVDEVYNPLPAEGGADHETEEQRINRGPEWVRHRNRAVTAADYEALAKQASRMIARAKCLAGVNGQFRSSPGSVAVIIVPDSVDERPMPSLELSRQVKSYLIERIPLVPGLENRIYVVSPAYYQVSVKALLTAQSWGELPLVEQRALTELNRFLHPLHGGSRQQGWGFGRMPCSSDFYALLERVEGVDYVEALILTVTDDQGRGVFEDAIGEHIKLPPNALITGGNHQIGVIASVLKEG